LNSGNARISVYVTNSIHHVGTSFGTKPEYNEAIELLNEYLSNTKIIKNDIQLLKTEHQTTNSVDELYETIKI
jgi:hypothetical protein